MTLDNTLIMPRSYVNNVGGSSYKNYNPYDIKNVIDTVRYYDQYDQCQYDQ